MVQNKKKLAYYNLCGFYLLTVFKFKYHYIPIPLCVIF